MACTKSTQTRPEFTWRFLTLGEFTNQIVNVTASTEHEAREKRLQDVSVFWRVVFALKRCSMFNLQTLTAKPARCAVTW